MQYWAGLYKSEFQEKLLDGVKVLLGCAHEMMAQQMMAPMKRLPAPPETSHEDEVERFLVGGSRRSKSRRDKNGGLCEVVMRPASPFVIS